MEKDMTAGTPGKIIFNFTMPIFIGNIFQQFYNMADAVIVGKFVGSKALAAVGTARGASDMRAPYSSSCSGRCRSAGHSKKLIM